MIVGFTTICAYHDSCDTSRVNNVIMIKTKVLLPQTYVTLPILAILFRHFGFIALKMPFQDLQLSVPIMIVVNLNPTHCEVYSI
jgi:hypothetical protein